MIQTCSNCQTENPVDNRFCGNCGKSLGGDRDLERQIGTLLDKNYSVKDFVVQSIAIEVENKIQDRLKTVTYFLGFPLGLLLIALSVMGMSSYQDARAKAKEAEDKFNAVNARLTEANQSTEDVIREADKFHKLEIDAEAALRNSQSNEQDIQKIAKFIHFNPSSDLSSASEVALTQQVEDYRRYLTQHGYVLPRELVQVMVAAQLKDNAGSLLPHDGVLTISRQLADTPGALLTEYTPYLLQEKELETDQSDIASYAVIGVALQRYLPASFQNGSYDPWLNGEDKMPPSIQSVSNVAVVPYTAFWRCRAKIGRDDFDTAVLRAWHETQRSYRDQSYYKIFFQQLLRDLPDGKRSLAEPELSKRGLLN